MRRFIPICRKIEGTWVMALPFRWNIERTHPECDNGLPRPIERPMLAERAK